MCAEVSHTRAAKQRMPTDRHSPGRRVELECPRMEPDDDTEGDDPIEIPVTDTLDLHAFRPEEIRDVARDYLGEARLRGFTQVRLIHGRGIGVQRERIRALLAELDYVTEFHDADHTGGGWGATVVLLRND